MGKKSKGGPFQRPYIVPLYTFQFLATENHPSKLFTILTHRRPVIQSSKEYLDQPAFLGVGVRRLAFAIIRQDTQCELYCEAV